MLHRTAKPMTLFIPSAVYLQEVMKEHFETDEY